MAFLLVIHSLCHGWRDALALRRFRKNREHLVDTGKQYDGCGVPAAIMQDIVATWMHKRPLPFLSSAGFKDIGSVFEWFRARGVRIVAYSDFPAIEKLQALGLEADMVVCSEDAEIGTLKPHPKGLAYIMHILGLKPHECLMIGDRESRDGAAARAHKMPFLLCKGPNFYTDMLTSLRAFERT